jgi:hypothetical protein
MRYRMMKMGVLAVALTIFASGAVAQHEEHHPEGQGTESQTTQPKAQNPTQPGMMGGGMMMMMMGQNRQMSDNISKIMQNMAAMQNEKDPAKMRSMVAAQSTMMQQMRDQMMQQSGMMQGMSAMMQGCPMMGGSGQPPAPGPAK